MADKTNNSEVVESVEVQEPATGLDGTEEVIEETGTVGEQPVEDSETAKAEKPEDTSSKDAKEDKGKVKKKGIDLIKAIEKLSPAEQKAFKDWQADYTKKSQSLTEIEKAKNEYEEYVKSLQSDPEISAIFKARAEKKAKEAEPDYSTMTDQEIFRHEVRKEAKIEVGEATKVLKEEIAELKADLNARRVEEGNRLLADFAKEKDITVAEALGMAKEMFNRKPTLDDIYKLKYFDTLTEKAKQEALADLDLKKQANLETGSVPTGVAPINPEKPTFAEAAMAAAKQTGINWDKVKTEE